MAEPLNAAEPVARAWAEYRAWTDGAADGQYEITEELAWSRLQREILMAAVVPVDLELPPEADGLDLPSALSDGL